MTSKDDAVIKTSAATLVEHWLGFMPARFAGALILTSERLTFDYAGYPQRMARAARRDIDLSLADIVEARAESLPPLFLPLAFWSRANLTVRTRSGDHHFRVHESEDWAHAITGTLGSSS